MSGSGFHRINVVGRGSEIELGQLYDARTGQFAAGFSAWNAADVCDNQVVKDCPKVEMSFSSSLSERDECTGLGAEGSIGAALGLFELSGSAKFLKEGKKHAHAAQVTAHCTVVTRERYMPMEQLTNVKHTKALQDDRFTHFVAQVQEGGRAHLTFSVQTNSAEEEQKIKGELKAAVKAHIGGAGASSSQGDKARWESCEVSLHCDYAVENHVHDFESAVGEAKQLTEKLKGSTNTLSAVLLPISLLDNEVARVFHEIDSALLEDTQKELWRARQLQLELQHCQGAKVMTAFPKLAKQISKFAVEFETRVRSFKADVKKLLPLLHHGSQDDNSEELPRVNSLMRRSSEVCERFLGKKRAEQQQISHLVTFAVEHGLEDRVNGETRPQASATVVEVSLGAINSSKTHPCQLGLQRVEEANNGSETGSEFEESDAGKEWFEDEDQLSHFHSQVLLAEETKRAHERNNNRLFCIGVCKPSRSLRIGDVVVTRPASVPAKAQLARAPERVRLGEATTSSLQLSWQAPGGGEAAVKCLVTLCLRDDEEGDGVVGLPEEYDLDITSGANKQLELAGLPPGSTYKVWVQTIGEDGLVSPSSEPCEGKTLSHPSLIPGMVDLFHRNEQQWRAEGWDCDETHLVLGRRTVELYKDPASGRVLVEIVEVAPSLDPGIPFPKEEESDVVLTTGASGHGKSTHINAWVNFLFMVSLDDKKRLLLVDDRGKDGRSSITSHITVYKIRAHKGSRMKKGMWLIDSPGFGDTRGIEFDDYAAETYAQLFKSISRLSCVVLVVKSTEERVDSRTKGAIAHIMHQFGKDVGDNILAVLTFCDNADPPAKKALSQLEVPVKKYIKTNNASFVCSSGDKGADSFGQLYWKLFMAGMKSMCLELAKLAPCSTEMSANVTEKRRSLNEHIAVLQEAVVKSVNSANSIVAQLEALSVNVAAPPNAKIVTKVPKTKKVDLEPGTHVTNCMVCNTTCHYMCTSAEDKKFECVAMRDGKCTVCKGLCHWTQHKTMQFYFVCEEVEEVVLLQNVIDAWDSNTRTIEGAVLKLIEGFINEQNRILELLQNMNQCQLELRDISLRDDPTALIDYIKSMIASARARGSHLEIEAMERALRRVQLTQKLGEHNEASQREHKIISDTMVKIRVALNKRSLMSPEARMEEQRSNLYNTLFDSLPTTWQSRAPPKLRVMKRKMARAVEPKIEDNLKAIIKLVSLFLQHGVFVIVQG